MMTWPVKRNSTAVCLVAVIMSYPGTLAASDQVVTDDAKNLQFLFCNKAGNPFYRMTDSNTYFVDFKDKRCKQTTTVGAEDSTKSSGDVNEQNKKGASE